MAEVEGKREGPGVLFEEEAAAMSLVEELRDLIADPDTPITQDFLQRLLAALEAK